MILRSNSYVRLERLERWSVRATLIILLGIVIETALLFWFPPAHIWETAATASAQVLIGLGLAAEYVVILRASATRGAAGDGHADRAFESRVHLQPPASHRPDEMRPPRPALRAAYRRRLAGFGVIAGSEAAKQSGLDG